MVDYTGIGSLLVGISALIGVIWSIISTSRNKKDLDNLKDVVEPMYGLLKELKHQGRLAPASPPASPPASLGVDQRLKRQELDLKREELEWKKLEGAAKAFGWILDRMAEDEEYDEEY